MGKTLALDSMLFIYLFEKDPRFFSLVSPLFKKIESGKIKAVTSIITFLEVLSAPKLEEEPEKLNVFTQFFQKTPNLNIIKVDWEIANSAAQLRRQHEYLRTPDSLQIAAALSAGSQVLITNDQKLLKYSTLRLPIVPLTKSTFSNLNI